MSITPSVLVVLAVCWTLPALLVAVAYKRERAKAQSTSDEFELEVVRHLRIASLDVEVKKEEKEWWAQTPAERNATTAASSVSRSVQHAAVITPYAEVSVTVSDPQGEKCVRRCSMCLN
jgi:hypothetical protein